MGRNKRHCDRRTVLKALSGAAIGVTSVGTASSSSEPDIPSLDAVICSNNSGNRFSPECGGGGGFAWDTVNSDYIESEVLTGAGMVDIATQVQHYKSEWVGSKNKWLHRMSLSSVAAGVNSGPNASSNSIGRDDMYDWGFEGQKFEVRGPNSELSASYDPSTDNNGVHPSGGSDLIANVVPFLEATTSEVIPGIGFLFAADDVLNNSNMLPSDTVAQGNNGYEYNNKAGLIDQWDWCSHFHEINLWDEAGICGIVDVDVGFCHKRKLLGNEWKNFKLDFVPDPNSWDRFNPSQAGSVNANKNDDSIEVSRTLNPEEMTQDQIDNLGIKQYTGERTITVDGEQHTPEYVMLNNPFAAIERR